MISKIAKAGISYFALVLGVGFVLGIVRELWAVPRFGVTLAELLEAPVMLIAIVFAARWTVARYLATSGSRSRIVAGLLALGLLLLVEFTVVLALRDMSVPAYIASRDPVSGTVYIVMLGVFAVMPGFVRRRFTGQDS